MPDASANGSHALPQFTRAFAISKLPAKLKSQVFTLFKAWSVSQHGDQGINIASFLSPRQVGLLTLYRIPECTDFNPQLNLKSMLHLDQTVKGCRLIRSPLNSLSKLRSFDVSVSCPTLGLLLCFNDGRF